MFHDAIAATTASPDARTPAVCKDRLADIRNTSSLSRVMQNGRLYDAWTLNEIAPIAKTRATAPREPLAGPRLSRALQERASGGFSLPRPRSGA